MTYLLHRILSLLPERVLWLFSRRYIAGRSQTEAMTKLKKIHSLGMAATMDVLGEDVTTPQQSRLNCSEYLSLIETCQRSGANVSISVKPSMLGLSFDQTLCLHLMDEIARCASEDKLLVQIDMEGSAYTDRELSLFTELYKRYPASTGIVLQAALRRSAGDLQRLAAGNRPAHPIALRICKGIYIEPETIAFTNRNEIRNSFLNLTRMACDAGLYPCIASHDEWLIEASLAAVKAHGLTGQQYELQMLYGVRPSLARSLTAQGQLVRIYLPYGHHWRKYSLRRLRENPSIVWHIVKALFRQG